ncbi:hypothetical protein [Ornithinimicrobium avium]|uniref:Uncharacterized protein n=1 Tax=Ornithinimicrobium avium TaxID=2283195 RepID=A0A345NMK6_9MICO|nr:hypothetical protein [Ornithinimicrobium avium]AXH96264.1 hypothetical protein DV701_09110 [Ornithinimicrobium avium]
MADDGRDAVARARHEAAWTHQDATVRGSAGRNRGWVMLAVGFAVIALLSIFAYNRLMNFQTVTFELQTCQASLGEDVNWADVEAAGCAPAPIEGDRLTMWHGGDQSSADEVTGGAWVFDGVPVNTVVNSMQIDTAVPARSVVLVEPDKKQVRTVLTSDSARTRWSGYVGDRAATTLWVLVTPEGG